MRSSPRLPAPLAGVVALAALGALAWLARPQGSRAALGAGPVPGPGAGAGGAADLVPPELRALRAAPGASVGPRDPVGLGAQVEALPSGRTWRLVGRVLDAGTGAPLERRVDLTLHDLRSKVSGMTVERGGEYGLATHTPGPHVVRVEAPGYDLLEETLGFDGPPRTIRRDLRLAPMRRTLVRVRTPEGEALEGQIARRRLGDPDELLVVATAWAPQPQSQGVLATGVPPRRGRHGAGAFDGTLGALGAHLGGAPVERDMLGILEAGPRARWAALLLRDTLLATRRLPDPGRAFPPELVFVVPLEGLRERLASVEVRVVEAGSLAPVAGHASVSPFDFLFLGRPLEPDGRALFTDLVPDLHWLVVEAEELETRLVPLRLGAGERRDLGTLELERPRSIAGRAVDARGEGVLADVTLVRTLVHTGFQGARTELLTWQRWTEEDGTFRFDHLGPGPYAAFLGADAASASSGRVLDWASPAVRVDVTRASAEGVRLQAEPGGELILERATLAGLPLTYEVRDADRVVLRRGELLRWEPARLRLAAGTYHVLLGDGVRQLELRGVEVGRGPARLVFER